jgi:PIN domain
MSVVASVGLGVIGPVPATVTLASVIKRLCGYGDSPYPWVMNIDGDLAQNIVVFLDSNIVLEGRPIVDLPWEEVIAHGTIQVLIVPKVMEEIDAKKRDGRLGSHARAFNRLIAQSVIDGAAIVLREFSPRVELRIATCSRIPWENYDELDPTDGDCRIVAEALNVCNVNSDRRMLVSHDIKPLAYARGLGLPVRLASDAWLRPIEPSPKDKEIQRLKQQVTEFRKDEPTFEISIEISDLDDATVYTIAPLETEEADAFCKTIRLKNGMKRQHRDPYGIASALNHYDTSYDDRYNRYISKTIPEFVGRFNDKLAVLFNQRLLKVHVTNSGQIRADHLVVSVSTSDGWINPNIVFVYPAGPTAPVPRAGWHHLHNMPGMHGLISPRVGRHEFEMIRPAKRAPAMEASCEDFRSGQKYHFEGVIMPTPRPDLLEVTVSVTAANLRGERCEICTFEKKIVAVTAADLVDLEAGTFKKDFPIKKEMERLLQLKRIEDIEFDDPIDDD